MFRKWMDDNLTMGDVIILAIIVAGLIAAFIGLKEYFGTTIGAATTYVVKDKTKRTQEAEKEVEERYVEILSERMVNDEYIAVSGATARAVVAGVDDHDELVRIANDELARIRGGRK